MASYTDAISTFNPYVSQIPVDAMVKVGMQKQAQYDQGVQKIQSYIDNVAGMEILNDTDKEYLHSKLNQLGSDLKVVAAGDFSNQQLVNSVGGMASQITRDANIQNAIFSTSNAKKQQAKIDADSKKGKLNQASEYIYNKELQKYMGNKEVGQRFTGQYKPKTSEYDKKILEAIKVLQPKITQQDIAYATDEKTGKVDPNKILPIMQRYTDKRVDEGQIRTALNAVLNAEDEDQLRMEGIFNYRFKNAKDVAEVVTEDANKIYKLSQQRLANLENKLPGLTDPDEILATKDLIADYSKKIGDPSRGIPGTIRINEQETLASLSDEKNLDQVKGNIFRNNTIDEYANGFAYAQIQNEIMTSPARKEQLDTAAQDLAVRLANETIFNNRFKRGIATSAEIRAQEKHEKEMGILDGAGGSPTFTGSGDETEDQRTSVTNFIRENNDINTDTNLLKGQLKNKMGGIFSDLTEAQVDAKIEEYKKDPVRNKPDDNSIKEIMDRILSNERYVAKKNIILNKSLDAATKEVTGGLSYEQFLKRDIEKLKGVAVTVNGKQEYFSPTEIASYLFKEKQSANIPKVKEGKITYNINPGENLNDKEVLLSKALAGRYNDNAKYDPLLRQVINSYGGVVNKRQALQSQITNKQVELLQPYTGPFKTEGAPITFSGKEGDNKQNLIDKLRIMVSNDARQKGGGSKYDTKEVLSTLNEKDADKLLGFGLERQGGTYYIQVQDAAGDFQNVPVTEEFVRKNLGSSWLNKGTQTQRRMFTLGGNTNPTNDFNLTEYAQNDFGNYDSGTKSVTLNIGADFRDQGNGNGAVTFQLKNKRGETIPIVWSGRSGITSIDAFPQWLKQQTDETLMARLRSLYPGVDEFLKR